MLRQVKGRWALVSKKTQRPLAYYKGEGKPSDEWVAKQERRIQFFKHGLGEEGGAGEYGTKEVVDKYMKDTPGQNITSFKKYIKHK